MQLHSIAELVNPGETVISITGAGGKTSLMYALANELTRSGKRVVSTTTTRIYPPHRSDTGGLVLQIRGSNFFHRLKTRLDRMHHVTAAYRNLPGLGKLEGLTPETAQNIPGYVAAAHVIVEADGASRKPLKAPADHEPVVPEKTNLCIGVMGLDALGLPLKKNHAFRPEIIAELTGTESGEAISPGTLARLVTAREGMFKGCPPEARKVVVLNKVDLPGAEDGAYAVIEAAKDMGGVLPDLWCIASVQQKEFTLIR